MHIRTILPGILLTVLAGCGVNSGSPTATNSGDPTNFSAPSIPVNSSLDAGLFDDSGKAVSSTYLKYFADSVNAQSANRWQVMDFGGKKTWILSNTAFSAPKAWVIGGGYWNAERDYLMSNEFTVTPGDLQAGVRVTFYSRWKIAAGDRAQVWWLSYKAGTTDVLSDAGSLSLKVMSGGQNADYPAWTKYTIDVPATSGGVTGGSLHRLLFEFQSDKSGTDWGIGIDNVAVYQRALDPAVNCSATDGAYPVTVTWDHNPSPGNLLPDSYAIYRSTTPGGGTYGYYEFQSEVKYPATSWQDFNVVPNTKYYYVIEARRYGHPAYPQYSNEDSGYFQYP